jgi:DNA-binding response OmpR family regulator
MTTAPYPAAIQHAVDRVGDELRLSDDARAVLAGLVEAVTEPRPIHGLSPTESRIVRALTAASPRVLSATHLLDVIGSDASMSVVTVHIAHIRKRRSDLRDSIRTIWGCGYCWDGPGPEEIAAVAPCAVASEVPAMERAG